MFRTYLVEKIKIHISCAVTFFFFENLVIYEIIWKSAAEMDRPQMTMWRMRIACWMPKATNTHSECAIYIAFLLSQLLHESASMLHYTYILCLATK
jgi:hypothetical protein